MNTSNSHDWLRKRPGATLQDYFGAMEKASAEQKHREYMRVMHPGEPQGYFKWLKTGDNGFLVGVWAMLAAMPLFGLLCVAWQWWGRQ